MLHVLALETARDMSLFAGLTEQQRNSLLGEGRVRNVPRGAMLFAHGDAVTHFYLVVDGALQLFRATPDGHEKTISIVKAGQTLCEDEIMDACHGHRANAVAVENASVLEFPATWLKDMARTHSSFALNLLSLISERAHIAEVEAEHQATMSAAQMVACFMQRLCVLHNLNPSSFDLPYSKTLIASRLGMELETFSRTIGKLKDHGIKVEGNKVMITDLGRISKYVCDFCSISGECATHQSLEKKMCGSKA